MDKPWTVSRGPITATEFDVKKAEAINALLVHPHRILPTKLGDTILPFAIGLFADVRGRLKPDIGAFVHSKRYYFASAQPDSIRHDIDGRPVEPLSAADRLVAQQRFLSLKRDNELGASSVEPTPSYPVLSKAEQIRAALLGRNGESRRPVS